MHILKKILVISLILSIACNDSNQSNSYTINLNIKASIEPQLAILFRMQNEEEVVIDSVMLKEGAAVFTGNLTSLPEGHYIRIDGAKRQVSFFLESTDMTIEAHIDSLRTAKISGSPLNTKYQVFNDSISLIRQEMQPLYGLYNAAEKAENKEEMDRLDSIYYTLTDQIEAVEMNFIVSNKNNVLGPYQATRVFYSDSRYTELDSLMNLFDPSLEESKYIKRLKESMDIWSNLQIGMLAPDFTQNDSTNNPVKLSDFRGKYLLVDFWAAWCNPCRAENPNIVKAYNKYKDDGFKILGVSLDEDRNRWLQAIEKDNLTWHQVSDLKGWSNEVSSNYGIRAIPYSLLIDPDGIIIGKNLRGEKLHEELEKIIKL